MYFARTPKLFHKLYPAAIWSSLHDSRLQWTFDDGPDPESTPALLAFLKEKNIKATFFCLGAKVIKYPNLYLRIIESGHQVGNHGYNHISGWSNSLKSYLHNIEKAQQVIDSKLFRPAYGRMTWRQYTAINKDLGMNIVLWNNMPGDFDKKITAPKLANRLQKITDVNSITVLHDHPIAFAKLQKAWSKK